MGMAPMGKTPTTLSEINVTPLVDVMLVLLIIFMIASSVETVQAEQEKQRIVQEQIELMKKYEEMQQQVPINLPKTNAEEVNLSETKKLVLTINADLEFFIGETKILSCLELAPELKKQPGEARDFEAELVAFKKCLPPLEEKLLENEKLQNDKELYLRADRSLDYGKVLMVMAHIRKAGITKFGLVAEPDLEE